MKTKTKSWILMAVNVIGGAALFCAMPKIAVVFGVVDDSYPIPIRVVMFVGPAGWLALAILSGLIAFRCRSERGSESSTIAFLLVAITVACTLVFTPFTMREAV